MFDMHGKCLKPNPAVRGPKLTGTCSAEAERSHMQSMLYFCALAMIRVVAPYLRVLGASCRELAIGCTQYTTWWGHALSGAPVAITVAGAAVRVVLKLLPWFLQFDRGHPSRGHTHRLMQHGPLLPAGRPATDMNPTSLGCHLGS